MCVCVCVYTPTLERSLAGNLMTGAPVKIRNGVFSSGKKSWEKSIRFLPSRISFFLSFKVVVWLLSWRFLNLGPAPLSKVSHQKEKPMHGFLVVGPW